MFSPYHLQVCVFHKCMFKEFVKSLTRPLIILYEMMILLMIYRTLYNNKLKNHITINIICGATCSTIKQVSKQVYWIKGVKLRIMEEMILCKWQQGGISLKVLWCLNTRMHITLRWYINISMHYHNIAADIVRNTS